MQGRRVAVTGVGVISPLGCAKEEYWRNLVAGRSGIRPITRFDTSQLTSRIAGEISQWDPSPWIERRLEQRLDRYAQFGLAAAIEAVKDSGLNFEAMNPRRIGVMIGTGIGGLGEMEDQHTRLLQEGPSRVRPLLVPKMMANACAGQVAIHFGLRGPCATVCTACAAATHSLGWAFHLVRNGKADVVIAGGAEATITPLGMAGFCSAKALSTRNDAPEKASRPFDRDRDGFVMGEGAGMLVLEEWEQARQRGAHIYAEFRGFGMTDDAVHITQPDPEGVGAAECMQAALDDAQMPPDEVDYINAHGTSTELNDVMETKAIKKVFGERAQKIAISSTKSMVGHLLGASGGVEAVAVVLCLNRGVVHPTINQENPDPECDLDYVPNVAREIKLRAAISNSFGFGGHNATIVLARV